MSKSNEILESIFKRRESISPENPFKVLFVCLGNICRSPTGEGIFLSKIEQKGLKNYFVVDSCGTAAYHVGEPAHTTSQSVANQHGVYLPSKGRQLSKSDFHHFDLILAMDTSNFDDIRRLDDGSGIAEVTMMRTFEPAPDSISVPDPYYGGLNGFERVFQVLDQSCEGLLDGLEAYFG